MNNSVADLVTKCNTGGARRGVVEAAAGVAAAFATTDASQGGCPDVYTVHPAATTEDL
jgi:hypothetical protein